MTGIEVYEEVMWICVDLYVDIYVLYSFYIDLL